MKWRIAEAFQQLTNPAARLAAAQVSQIRRIAEESPLARAALGIELNLEETTSEIRGEPDLMADGLRLQSERSRSSTANSPITVVNFVSSDFRGARLYVDAKRGRVIVEMTLSEPEPLVLLIPEDVSHPAQSGMPQRKGRKMRVVFESLGAGSYLLNVYSGGTVTRPTRPSLSGDSRRLLIAAAYCNPDSFWWPFVVRMSGLESVCGEAGRNKLIHARRLVPLGDPVRQRFRLNSRLREKLNARSVSVPQLQEAHAQTLEQFFDGWESKWQDCLECLLEILTAVKFLWNHSRERAAQLAWWGYSCAYRTGELETALRIAEKNTELAMKGKDPLCRDILQRSYGNRARVHHDWGNSTYALDLLQKKEKICKELRDDDGLQACYFDQARILKDCGRLRKAMALLKKQEKLCLKLDSKDGLQASYGDQALILDAWGDQKGALDLLAKQEKMCLQLNDANSRQVCMGNQAGILTDLGRLQEALKKLRSKEEICEELENQDSLQICYGQQAQVLMALQEFEAARERLQRKQKICEDLGKLQGLAYCSWDWAKLARLEGDSIVRKSKLEEALRRFTELQMPCETSAVQTELSELAATGRRQTPRSGSTRVKRNRPQKK